MAAVVVACGSALGLLYYAGTHLRPTAVIPATVAALPYPTPSGTLVFSDGLTQPSSEWSNSTHCFFGTGGYHVTNRICYAPAGVQTDIDVVVQVEQISGPTNVGYGITFRATPSVSHYTFGIDGLSHWALFKCDSSGSCMQLVDYTPSASIRGGLNTANTVEVRAIGSHFTFVVNGTMVGTYDDSSLDSGKVGLDCGDTIECVFTNLIIVRPD
jgi:hypothetical protein